MRHRHVAPATAYYCILYYCMLLYTVCYWVTHPMIVVLHETNTMYHARKYHSVIIVMFSSTVYSSTVYSSMQLAARRVDVAWAATMQYMQSCSTYSIHCTTEYTVLHELSWAAEHAVLHCILLQYTALSWWAGWSAWVAWALVYMTTADSWLRRWLMYFPHRADLGDPRGPCILLYWDVSNIHSTAVE